MGDTEKRRGRGVAKIKAVGYLRTSSATNVGNDKDSEKRQRAAIERFCKSAGYVIADDDWFYDEAVSGVDALGSRPGWNALMDRIMSNGVRTVIVEDASRFARDLIVQEIGVKELRSHGVTLITAAEGVNLTEDGAPERKMIRRFVSVLAEYEKDRLVAKLKAARDRKIEETGRCGGRQPIAETHPEATALAKRLHRASPKTGKRLSLRKIAAKLAEEGFLNSKGDPFTASVVASMVES